MFPIRDKNPTHRTPWVTYAIIAANAAVWIHEIRLGRAGLEFFTRKYALIPAVWSGSPIYFHYDFFDKITPLVTSMFLHGGWMHILSNLWMLWIFGDNVEDRLGRARYLIFYLFCGVIAGLLHLFTNWGSAVPTLGASGAIAGVMGAYMLLFPWAKVVTVIPVFIFLHYAEIPAAAFLVFWFLLQLYSGTLATGSHAAGIAWWAHIGGFLGGMYFVMRFVKRRRRRY